MESLPPIPKSQPTRLDPQLERLILHLRDSSGFGPKRLHYWLKRNLKIEIATSTIAKYLHKHGQTKKHLRRRAAKSFDWKSLPLFSALQVDTKEIIDTNTFTQEEKGLYKRLGLPLYQFTAIFPRIRARFISYSFQNTKRASLNFLEYLFSHLESHGAPFEETISFQNLKDFMLKASEWIYYYNYDRSHDGLGGPVLAGLGQGRALLRL